MISINVTVHADEVLFRLDQIPVKLRAALREKFDQIFSEVREQVFSKTPGQYLDPEYIKTGVEVLGSTLIGFIEVGAKPGTYSIIPNKARALRFLAKDGMVVRTKFVNHPFLKGAPIVEKRLRELKPWIEDQLTSATYESLRR